MKEVRRCWRSQVQKKIYSVRSNFSLCCCDVQKKKEMSRQRAMITFPFWFSTKLLLLVPWAGIRFNTHQQQQRRWAVLYIPVWIFFFFGHNPKVVVFLPFSKLKRWGEMRMTPCMECWIFFFLLLCRGRTVHFRESTRKEEKKGRSDRCCWRKVYTHTQTQNTDVVAYRHTFYFGR